MIVFEQSMAIETDASIAREPVLTQSNENKMSGNVSETAMEQQNGSSSNLKRKSSVGNEELEYFCDSFVNSENEPQIEKSDLEELLCVYKKCKKVIKKIETKYGHLLNLSEGDNENTEDNTANRCNCASAKKIIFDDSGNQTVLNNSMPEHICVDKLVQKTSYDYKTNDSRNRKNVKVEFEMKDLLPNDLSSLFKMLKNKNLNNIFRNKITRKIKLLQYEYRNELKFQKPSLISQVKSDPEELIEFKGSNLFELSGYFANK